MALTEETVIDKIEVVAGGAVQVRRALRVLRDGADVATTYHRVAYAPGSDVSHEAPEVQAIAKAAWGGTVAAPAPRGRKRR